VASARETSIRRGVETLLALTSDEARAAGGLGVTRIAEVLDREKSQVSRALKVLAEYGLVERNRDALTYRLGWRIFALAQLAGEPRFIEEAGPILRRLVASLSERVHLTALQGADVLTLMSESPSRAVEAVGWVGRATPAYCTSAGFALLFDHSRDELERLFAETEMRPLAPNTPTDVDDLAARLEAAREHGVVVTDEVFEAGLIAAAAPVRDNAGRIVAAVNCSAPRFRFADRIYEAATEVKAAAGELSNALAGAAPDPV
jgi:IclR family transcriptional regulator, KDG regulon repressor